MMGYFSLLVRIGDTGGDVTFCRRLEPPWARVAEQKRGKVERERAYEEIACVMHRRSLVLRTGFAILLRVKR
jgi:hypothetical protein